HSLGSVTLQNTGSSTITDLSLRLFIPGLMQTPSEAQNPRALGVGQSISVDLPALLDSGVLDRGEAGSVSAELTVEYVSGGKPYKEVVARPIGVLNRNAIRWDDDRKVASFMITTDPALLRFSGQIMGMVEDTPTNLLTQGFLSAIRLFSGMQAAGIHYVVDPQSSYESLSRDSAAIDFVRFPIETLDAKSGDCDDLSVLYNTLLESVGVSTAFITTPGHIFTAFDSGIPAELAGRVAAKPEEVIVRDGSVWIPVETTALDQGFVKAWQIGAVEWREAAGRKTGKFFTTKDAWQLYPPAGFSAAQGAAIPSQERVLSQYKEELSAYRNHSLVPRETALLADISESPSSAGENQLGILYAQFGLFSKALEQFDHASSGTPYLPALINAANILSIQKQYDAARSYLKRAGEINPDNAHVLVRLAYSYLQSGKESEARSTFERMSKIDPALAERFPLFGPAANTPPTPTASGSSPTGRAAKIDSGQLLFGSDWITGN
ncbi:MAG TPA: tetratricopeptide repeat protein, partial [Spirochaetia bacterium]|nr:tetratricopeptide repeat protein [Spirochaetia bacterium]